MGSPAGNKDFGSYVGDGSAALREFKAGFAPGYLKIWSAEGTVEFTERLPQAAKRLATGVLSFIDGLSCNEHGWSMESADDALNKTGVVYYYMSE